MPNIPLNFGTGMIRPATVHDAKGRFWDGNLVRWRDGALQPFGGWTTAYASTGAGDRNTKPIRGMMAYQVDIVTRQRRMAYGTYEKAFQYAEDGSNYAITPGGFVAGLQHATLSGGSTSEATSWSFDTMNSDLIAFGGRQDGLLYYLSYLSAVTVDLALISTIGGAVGVPTGNVAGVVVTPENFLFALGANAYPKRVQWPDQGGYVSWTPASTNQAGGYDLPTSGWIQAGKKGRGITLIWTDVDLWTARYTGDSFVYRFDLAGSECGAISKRSMAMVDGRAYWMGRRGFFMWDGFVRPIACPVGDYVFSRLLQNYQRSKVAAIPNTDFGEITWVYPSGSSSTAECDSYVTYNYLLDIWYLGFWNRTDGIDRMFWENPIYGAVSGALYAHENATTYTEEDSSSLTPYIESGPLGLGEEDNVYMVRNWIPDANTTTGVTLTLFSKLYPTGSETSNGPYTASISPPTGMRVTAREVRCKYIQSAAGWRIGTPYLEVVSRGKR